MSENLFSLFLSDPTQFQIPVLAKALIEIRKIPMADASMIAKKSWGLLEKNLEREKAQQLQAQYKSAGISTFVIEDAAVALPKPERIKKISYADQMVNLSSENKSYEGMLWCQLGLIAVLGYEETSSYSVNVVTGPSASQKILSAGIMLTTGIPISIGPKKSVTNEKRASHEFIFSVDLFFREPRVRFRIEANNFDYSFLKERKEFNGPNNFRLFLADAITAAPQAKLNKGATILSQKLPVNQMGYEGHHDFDKECQWLWALLSFAALP